ncbi:MAG: mercury methylation ferredoxin HgcB [Deltaproteobacteria bacterium]|jgi:ferredoxin
MERFVYLKDVVTLALDEEKCVGCGLCLTVCPRAVFSINDRHARIDNRDLCMECGACSRNCPTGALTVQTGVGCAAAVINAALGRNSGSCCCVIEPDDKEKITGASTQPRSGQTGCC